MTLQKQDKYFLIVTSNLIERLSQPIISRLIMHTLEHISPETDWVMFDPDCEESHKDDGGRSWVLPAPELPEIVYAKLDDYGSVENLREKSGEMVNTQYAVTLMWASDR